MADMTRTVASSGADHTTIADAMSYIVSNWSGYSGSDKATILLVADEVYDVNNVAIGGISGTPSATSYLTVKADVGVECGGSYSGARAECSGTSHCFTVNDDYVHFKNFAVFQDNSTSSAECFRCASGENLLWEKMFCKTANTSQHDIFYVPSVNAAGMNNFDCVAVLGGANARCVVHPQGWGSQFDVDWYIEHCTFDCNGAGSSSSAAIGVWSQNASDVVDYYLWNSALFNAGTEIASPGVIGDIYESGTVNFSGQGNLADDTTLTTRFGATNNNNGVTLTETSSDTGDVFLLTDIDIATFDAQLLEGDGDDVAVGGAISPTSGTRDSRVDLTEDINGNPRPATFTNRDIGASELLAAGINPALLASRDTIILR